MAYCLLHYTSFFEALENANDKIMTDLSLSAEEFEKYFKGVKTGFDSTFKKEEL